MAMFFVSSTTPPFDALYELTARGALDALDAGDGHDRATLAVDRVLLEHVPDRVPTDEERAGEVDPDHPIPFRLVDEMHRTTTGDAGGGDDAVDASVLGDDPVDQPAHRVVVANVDREPRRRPATSAPTAVPPSASMRRDGGQPDTRRRARDQHDLVRQLPFSSSHPRIVTAA